MLDKIKKYQLHPLVQQLRDVRVIGLLVFGAIVLLVTSSSVGVIQTNYNLQKSIARFEEQNKVQALENANIRLKNEYYKTDQYLELQARRQFGKAAPGEKVFLVPKSVALSKTVDPPKADSKQANQPVPTKPMYQKNFEAWMDFFFHRSNS